MALNVTKIMTNRGITRTPQQLTSRHDDLAVLLGVSVRQDEFAHSNTLKGRFWNMWIKYIDDMVDKAFNIRHFDIK